jgi:hypothetical protein
MSFDLEDEVHTITSQWEEQLILWHSVTFQKKEILN